MIAAIISSGDLGMALPATLTAVLVSQTAYPFSPGKRPADIPEG